MHEQLAETEDNKEMADPQNMPMKKLCENLLIALYTSHSSTTPDTRQSRSPRVPLTFDFHSFCFLKRLEAVLVPVHSVTSALA